MNDFTGKVTRFPVSFGHAERLRVHLVALEAIIGEIEVSERDLTMSRDLLDAIDHIETRLSLLRTRFQLKRSTVHLCSEFGRAP